MTGVVAELHRRNAKGEIVESELVFRSDCTWYIPKLGDTLGEITFSSAEQFVKEFGANVLEKVMNGEIVPVKTKASSDMENRNCPHKDRPWRRASYRTMYPYEGTQEVLTRF
jgi:hypothetical protein